jgi:two-component system, cell cycle sensor histidine kinase and response regulator CckA
MTNNDLTERMNRIHILVIDDDQAVLKVTTLLLERQGYLVSSAISGKEAFTKIIENSDAFDIVLTDYGMPNMNGIELAMMIKEHSIKTPIILFTGDDNEIYESLITQAGISAVARKPCSMIELDSIIKCTISNKRK